MEEKELINKIELLKDIKPKEEWVISFRARLAFRMEMERKKSLLNKDIFALDELFSFWKNFNLGRTFKAIYVSAVVFALIVCGGGLTVFAAMKSLPGSNFYQVKLALEKAYLYLTLSSDGRIKMQSQLANRRLEELKQIVENHESTDQKQAKVEQVVGQIQQQLMTFKDQLPQTKDIESQKSVATAKRVGEKANQIEKALNEAKNSLLGGTNQSLNNRISEVAEAAEKTGNQALEIIIDKQAQANPAERQEVLAKIEERINSIKAEIKSVEEKLALNGIKASSGIKAILIMDQSVIEDQLKKASELLDKATESLNQQDASTALKTVEAVKGMVAATEIAVADIVIEKGGTINPDFDKSATSSSPIVPVTGN